MEKIPKAGSSGDRVVHLQFVPHTEASSTSQSARGVKQKKLKVEESDSNKACKAPLSGSLEVGAHTESGTHDNLSVEEEEVPVPAPTEIDIDQLISDTAEFFYDQGWNDREEVIVFIINSICQPINFAGGPARPRRQCGGGG